MSKWKIIATRAYPLNRTGARGANRLPRWTEERKGLIRSERYRMDAGILTMARRRQVLPNEGDPVVIETLVTCELEANG